MPESKPTTQDECEQRVREILLDFGCEEVSIEKYWEYASPFIGNRSPRQAMEEGKYEDALIPAEAAADGSYI